MKRSLIKILSLILIIVIMFSINNIPAQADSGTTGILEVINDGDGHQALRMVVRSVASTSSLQAFCVGWNLTFSNSNGSVPVSLRLTPIDTDGGGRTYILPLTNGWTKASTGIYGAKSISDLVGDKTAFNKIIKAGCTVYADAKIEKYSYSNGKATGLGIYADNSNEIGINFSEFSDTFKTTIKKDYFNLSRKIPPEAIPLPDPYAEITLPINGSTVLRGTVVPFKGWGTGVHHIGGFVDDVFLEEQGNPSDDYNDKMWYETTVKLDELGPHTFYLLGRNAATGGKTYKSKVHTVYVIAPPPNSGTIHVKGIDIDTNKEISEASYDIPGVEYGKPKTVTYTPVTAYKVQGSYQTFSTSVPDKSKMQTATSQTVTISSINKKAYLYFWYKFDNTVTPPKPPVPINYNPIAIINNVALAYAGDDVKIDGSKSYDEDGTIEHNDWNVPGTYGSTEEENSIGDNAIGIVWYPTVGEYDIGLTVTDDDGDIGEDLSSITIIPPVPSIVYEITADKMKENRKITLDVSKSTSAKKFPIDWSLTTWTIEPVNGSGATGDYGVRLEDGRVYKNLNGTAQLYNNGTWTATGLASNAILKGQKILQFQARDSGKYTATVTLTNTGLVDSTKHYSSTSTREINVVEDLAPIAAFDGAGSNVRDIESPNGITAQKYTIIPVTCTTTSPDGDPIGIRKWGLRYDSDDDGLFTDEMAITPYIGSASFTSGIRFIVDGNYDTVVEIQTYEVGRYTEELEAFEDIFDIETVKELLIPIDYKSNYVKGW